MEKEIRAVLRQMRYFLTPCAPRALVVSFLGKQKADNTKVEPQRHKGLEEKHYSIDY
jgi:hypothetical protein